MSAFKATKDLAVFSFDILGRMNSNENDQVYRVIYRSTGVEERLRAASCVGA